MDSKTQKWYGIVAAAVVIIAAAGWYFSAHNRAVAPSPSGSDGMFATTTGQGNGTAAGGTSVIGVPDQSNIPKPDLNRPYTPSASLPANVQAESKKKVAEAITQLKIDPNHIGYWLQLAVYRKGANDFVGAEEVWLYCTKRWPTDFSAYENLGDLYAYSIKDSAKAVEYWKKAIAVAPTHTYTYANLATFQNINLKDKAAAQATLEAGLRANPGDPNLQSALDQLQ